MAKAPLEEIEEMEGFLGLLEHSRLELVERIIRKEDRRHTVLDLEQLGLYDGAIRSVKGAIEFSKRTLTT